MIPPQHYGTDLTAPHHVVKPERDSAPALFVLIENPRLGTDHEANLHKLRHAIRRLFDQVSPGNIDPQLRQTLQPWVCDNVINIVHLIYQAKPYEAQFKDYAFGLGTQREHWAAGRTDMEQSLEHPDFFAKPARDVGVATHDVHRLVAARRERA